MTTIKSAFPANLKHKLVETWARRCLGKLDHEYRVASIAYQIFNLTRHLHDMDMRDLRLLCLGAIVHDIGRCEDEKRHPQLGARMIQRQLSLPLGETERRQLCYLTRHHRGAVPEIGYDDYLQKSDERKKMRLLLAILRAADALDNRQNHSPQIELRLRSKKLKIRCLLDDRNLHIKRYLKRRKKMRLLEELLQLKISVEIDIGAPGAG